MEWIKGHDEILVEKNTEEEKRVTKMNYITNRELMS